LKLPIKAKGRREIKSKAHHAHLNNQTEFLILSRKKANPSHIDSYMDTAAARGEDQAGPILILTSLGWVRRFNGQAYIAGRGHIPSSATSRASTIGRKNLSTIT
jgi:hypothetical protein